MKSVIGKRLVITVFLSACMFMCISFSIIAEAVIAQDVVAQNKEAEIDISKIEEQAIEEKDDFFGDEEKVVISIINFGRKNPFKPYVPPVYNIQEEDKEKTLNLNEVPYPPAYVGETDSTIQELMLSKVNGILYDPYARSVAIVNIKGTEYMLHKGDLVAGVLVEDIAEKNVTLKYGNNTYTVAVGEVIEGSMQAEQVQRAGKIFGGSDYELPDISLEE